MWKDFFIKHNDYVSQMASIFCAGASGIHHGANPYDVDTWLHLCILGYRWPKLISKVYSAQFKILFLSEEFPLWN